MAKLVDVLQMKYEFDVILFDTPPCLAVSDTSALALAISAPIVFIVQSGRTRQVAARKAKEQFADDEVVHRFRRENAARTIC